MKTIIIDSGDPIIPEKIKYLHQASVIVIQDEPDTIEIEGVKYQEIEANKPKHSSRRSSSMLTMLAATMMLAGGEIGMGYTRKRPDVDIVEEFKLIQQKKSNLSRNDRDWVVRVFNSKYGKVKQN